MQSISSKTPAEIIPVTFDYTAILASIDAVLSVTIAVYTGTDAEVGTMLSGGPNVAGTQVTQLVRNGVAGVVYMLTALVTSGTSKYELAGFLPVQAIT